MPKLFITGSTGYIGGDALYVITKTFPDLEITAVVRNSAKGAKVASQYPNVRLVYGDLDSIDLLTEEASKADVVVHTANCDHVASAEALLKGLGQKEGKSWLIHTSGTGMLSFADFDRKSYGQRSEKVYDDWDGIKEVTSIPDHAAHRNVDKIILGASDQYPGKVSTAIVCPPCIWGPGRGPDNKKSMQVYRMASATLKRGKGFHVEEGKNRWTEIHVQDLSDVYAALVNAALEGGGKATWNDEGYYFTENGDIVWEDIAKGIAKAAFDKGLIKTVDVENVSPEEAEKLSSFGSYLWGMNSRCRAYRARKLLGWNPKQPKVESVLPTIVEGEAKELGLIKGHAEQAAG
ncbi:NAD(P)-binding protein [Polyplosphaeria fusca]|uniref:NAD(P)-binding protein n=1 Tax=Polyplosphaeria fusca TaxID=682080 RepID=A0A9P4R4S3_9PLEO|nr:NAD(P)-binding protein [Polyplosphaeria fusca]